jgi:hypothetical protein
MAVLVVLLAARAVMMMMMSCEHCPGHCLLGGLAIRFVWGMGEAGLRFFGPQKIIWYL